MTFAIDVMAVSADRAEVVANVPAFAHCGAERSHIRVYAFGEVRVFDPVAGYFTLAHSLPEWHASRVRRAGLSAIASTTLAAIDD